MGTTKKKSKRGKTRKRARDKTHKRTRDKSATVDKNEKRKVRKIARDKSYTVDENVVRKQEELMRVLHAKTSQLQNGNLSYLEYIELREELARLNALKDTLTNVITIN
ncbi:uncharacterized protein [Musca autumnalis]|uniref:uncharacterized protein n=1 Tax=Musca autumnalis TaxID=221902 RepID=UPI003CE98766